MTDASSRGRASKSAEKTVLVNEAGNVGIPTKQFRHPNIESPEVISKQLLDAIIAAPDGHLKNASDAGSKMVRRRIRENGFTRLILPFKPVSNGDLARLPGTELPVMIEEMEPDSPGAKSLSFNDSVDTAFYRGDKFVVYFASGYCSRESMGSITSRDVYDRMLFLL